MSEVTLKINQRGYSMSCDPGQEERLEALSDFVNSRLSDIENSGAAKAENHLLVLTSLVLADEVFELRDEVAALNQALAENSATPYNAPQYDENDVAKVIDHLSSKIEHITAQLKRAESKAA